MWGGVDANLDLSTLDAELTAPLSSMYPVPQYPQVRRCRYSTVLHTTSPPTVGGSKSDFRRREAYVRGQWLGLAGRQQTLADFVVAGEPHWAGMVAGWRGGYPRPQERRIGKRLREGWRPVHLGTRANVTRDKYSDRLCPNVKRFIVFNILDHLNQFSLKHNIHSKI